MVPIAYRGSTKEGEVSFSTGIDAGLRADLVSALVIVEGEAGDVISVACGGNEHGVEANLYSRLLTQLV